MFVLFKHYPVFESDRMSNIEVIFNYVEHLKYSVADLGQGLRGAEFFLLLSILSFSSSLGVD